jgi:uncharacterized protein YdeI (BOF family)
MRPRILVLILAVAMGAAIVFWFTRGTKKPAAPATAANGPAGPAQSTPSTSQALTSQRSLQLDINHLGLTPERAKTLFSLTVGPLPGVNIDGLTSDPTDFDGTAAVLYLQSQWRSLTPEQRKAAHDLIRPPKRAGLARSTLPSFDMWTRHQPTLVLAGYDMPLGADDNLPAHDYTSLGTNANNQVAQFLGVTPVGYVVEVGFGPPKGTEFAHTSTWDEQNQNQPYPDGKCHSIVWDQKFLGLDDISTAAVLSHEVTHCYQDRVAGTYDNRAAQPRWMADGEATWVMATVVPSASQVVEHCWVPYVYGPKTVFSDRWYDAIGVFGHMSDITGASIVWPRLMSIAKVSEAGDDVATLNTLIQGVSSSYFSSWGASYFQQPHDRWNIHGPGHPPSSGPAPDSITVNHGDEKVLDSTPSYQASLYNVSGDADIVTVKLLSGYGRLHDAGYGIDTSLDASGPLVLCLKNGGCTCPPDSTGKVIATKEARGPLSVGLDGGDSTAQIVFTGHSLDEFCKPKKPKPPNPPGNNGDGGGGDGGDNQDPAKHPQNGQTTGDPHLRTFDGVPFDFQRVGEYTLAKSTKDDFTVQVRQIPVRGSRAVAFNQAMATKLGGKRVTTTLEGEDLVLRIDGIAVSSDPPAMSGGSITRAVTSFGALYTLEWPDGTIVTAWQLGRYGLNVGVKPSAARRGALEGVLGDANGAGQNDDVDPASLASKWLVPASASLFDYAPGQTAATFVDPTFPDNTQTVPNRDAAERDCREEGITDPTLLHNCIIDFGITNGFLFASQYAQQQEVLTASVALLSGGAPPLSAADTRVLTLAGSITDPDKLPQVPFTANANDVIFVHQPDCVDHATDHRPVFFGVFDPGGNRVGEARPGCDLGRIRLPVSGTYTLRAVGKAEPGPFSLPIRFVRHDREKTIKYGDVVSGNIEQRAAQDRYTFTAQAGDLIQIAGKGCDVDGLIISIVSPAGWDMLGPSCRQGVVAKIEKAGTYVFLVNSDNGGPAKYRFVFQGVSTVGGVASVVR